MGKRQNIPPDRKREMIAHRSIPGVVLAFIIVLGLTALSGTVARPSSRATPRSTEQQVVPTVSNHQHGSKPQPTETPTRTQPLAAPVVLSPIISDSQFVYGPNVGDFNVKAFLEKYQRIPPKYGDEIDFWADYESVNPRVLLALLTMIPGIDPKMPDFPLQVRQLAQDLRANFSWHRYTFGELKPTDTQKPDSLTVSFQNSFEMALLDQVNSGTYAIAVTLAKLTTPSRWSEWVSRDEPESFYQTYRRLFPESDPRDESNNITPPGPPPADLLQLPFPLGDRWKFNGPHNKDGGTNNYDRPWPSMDFWPEKLSCNPPPGNRWAVAAADGVIEYRKNATIRLNHGNGWYTTYYHLRNLQSGDNEGRVRRNDPLGTISCEHPAGGSAPFPHVHFSLKYNGEFVDSAGTRLSGWEVYEGNAPYRGSLRRDGTEVSAYSYVYNDGGTPRWATLSFTIRLKNSEAGHDSEVAVVVLQPGTNRILLGPRNVSTNADGYYGGLVLEGVDPGIYHICTKAKYYLGQCAWNVNVSPGATLNIDFSNGGTTPAWPGDIDRYGQDNQINTLDREVFKMDMRACPGCSGQRFDFDRNGFLEATDLALVLITWTYHPVGEGVFNNPFPSTAQVGGEKRKSTQLAGLGEVSLQPGTVSKNVGDIIPTAVIINTDGTPVSGADVKLYYDPGVLEVVDENPDQPGIQISNGSIFSSVYRNEVDTSQGIVWFGASFGSTSNEQFGGTGTLATLRFRALAGASNGWMTRVIPVVSWGASDDSNAAEYDTGYDNFMFGYMSFFTLYGQPSRPAPSILLSPASNSVLGDTLVPVTAQVNNSFNQVERVEFHALHSASGQSWELGADSDGSDGWGVTWDTIAVEDRAGIELTAEVFLRTGGSYTAQSKNITLDRTPPTLQSVDFTPPSAPSGATVDASIDVDDNLSQAIHVELWVNTANDSSELGEWEIVDFVDEGSDSTTLTWDTTGFPVGDHLVGITLVDEADNFNRWTGMYTIDPPSAPDSFEPDDSCSQAKSITPGIQQTHSISPAGDDDWVKFSLTSPADVTIETDGPSGNTVLWLYESDCATEASYDDDGGRNFFSRIQVGNLPAGTYYILVREYGDDGVIDPYYLELSVAYPDTENPVVSWIAPVSNEQVYHVGDEIVRFEVGATDNGEVSAVRFYWWDAANEQLIVLGEDYTVPYAISVDSRILNYEWNEIDAEAYDRAGNTDLQWIWLYRDRPPSIECYDVDGDGEVNVNDVEIVAGMWRQPAGSPYDRDHDGFVTVVDIRVVAQ